jgi:hypothetical protein
MYSLCCVTDADRGPSPHAQALVPSTELRSYCLLGPEVCPILTCPSPALVRPLLPPTVPCRTINGTGFSEKCAYARVYTPRCGDGRGQPLCDAARTAALHRVSAWVTWGYCF